MENIENETPEKRPNLKFRRVEIGVGTVIMQLQNAQNVNFNRTINYNYVNCFLVGSHLFMSMHFLRRQSTKMWWT